MPVRTYVEAIREGLREEMRRDARVMIFGEDVGAKGGVFGVTRGLSGAFPGRVGVALRLVEQQILAVREVRQCRPSRRQINIRV